MLECFPPGLMQGPVPSSDCEACLCPAQICLPGLAVLQVFEQQRPIGTGMDGKSLNPPLFEQGIDLWFQRVRSI